MLDGELILSFDYPLGIALAVSLVEIFSGIYYLKHPEEYYVRQKLYSRNPKKKGWVPSKRFLLYNFVSGLIMVLVDLALILYYLNIFYASIQKASNLAPADAQQAIYSAWGLVIAVIVSSLAIIILSYYKVDSIEIKSA